MSDETFTTQTATTEPTTAAATVPITAARKRLNGILETARRAGKSRTEPIEIDGTKYFVKRLAISEIWWCQLSALRGNRHLELIDNDDDLRALAVAALYMTITDENGFERQFKDLSEVAAIVDSTDRAALGLVETLTDAALELNPGLLPNGYIRSDIPAAPPMPATPPNGDENTADKAKTRKPETDAKNAVTAN
jgi:hypothetical protein